VVPNSKAQDFPKRWEKRNTFTLKNIAKKIALIFVQLFYFIIMKEKETLQSLNKHRVVSSKQE